MNSAMMFCASAVFVVAASGLADADNSSGLLNMLVTADIGHSRGTKELLTSPWPMDKSAYEGAFSLYEGLYDYVTRQGARFSSAVIMGDVAYGGGDIRVTEATRKAFQKYLGGTVPEDRVYVAIGNHDVHYLGCTDANFLESCYYGSDTSKIWRADYNMTFGQWRSNWLQSFPGLKTAISPPRCHGGKGEGKGKGKCNGKGKGKGKGKDTPWLAPSRYNINLDDSSSVYFIVGLKSGSTTGHWNGDTPLEATDSILQPDVECEFLSNSLAHGRSLGKTIFIYVTHDFAHSCNQWPIMRQVDIWMYGHKHNYWQSPLNSEIVLQEDRYYPLRFLIGNGGFDEGYIDVVSFAHVTEEPISGGGRVRLNFKVFDTCVSNETSCPDSSIPFHAGCWRACKAFPGGFDNGGGPRMATPSKHDFGFQFEAPRKIVAKPKHRAWDGLWTLQVSKGRLAKFWLTLGNCPFADTPYGSKCVRTTSYESAAARFEFYDVHEHDDGNLSVRVAVDDDARANLLSDNSSESLFYRSEKGFWQAEHGIGHMHPSHGYSLMLSPELGPGTFKPGLSGSAWTLNDVGWKSIRQRIFVADALSVIPGESVHIEFKRWSAPPPPPPQVSVLTV